MGAMGVMGWVRVRSAKGILNWAQATSLRQRGESYSNSK